MRLHQDLRARGALLLTLAALPFALAACGGSSNASSTTSSANAADTARIKFTQCMRSNGVDIPDPGQAGAGGGGGFRQALRNIDRTKLQAAQKACAKFRTQAFGNITPAQRQAFQDAFTKFAACMRAHGVDLPDPGTGGPGGGGAGSPAGGAPPAGRPRIDRNDPKVQAAQKACQSNLPQGGRGGGFFFGGGRGGGGAGGGAVAGQAQ